MTSFDTPPIKAPTRTGRLLQILDGITLTLLTIGLTLMALTVRRVDLQTVLLVVAALVIGITTIVSIRRRRNGYEPVASGRQFVLWTLLRTAPNVMLLIAAVLAFYGKD